MAAAKNNLHNQLSRGSMEKWNESNELKLEKLKFTTENFKI